MPEKGSKTFSKSRKGTFWSSVSSWVVGEDTGLVAANQQERGHVSGEGLEPGHVHGGGTGALARHREGPRKNILNMSLNVFFYSGLYLSKLYCNNIT